MAEGVRNGMAGQEKLISYSRRTYTGARTRKAGLEGVGAREGAVRR